MNLQHLYYFKTIAEMEHYTRASEVLSISQSSLSHAIQNMERELNVKLFTRNGRNIVLTKYGEMFLPYVNQSLGILEAGLSELKHSIDPDTGTITIAYFPSLAQFVPDIIVRYVSESNRVDVRVRTNQEPTYYVLREQLLSGSVDLVFATEVDDPRVGMTHIGEHELVLLVPKGHRLDTARSVNLRELDGEDFIAYSQDSQLRHQLDSQFRSAGVRPKITAETAQDVIIFGLVSAGRGVAITPYPLGGAPYNVSVVPIEDLPMRKLYLMWNKEAYLPAAAAYFRDFVVRHGRVLDDYWVRSGVDLTEVGKLPGDGQSTDWKL